MRQARPRYRASRFSSSLPTAVTARTGTPASSPSSTSFPRFTSESCSWAAPTKIERATAEAFNRTASFIEVVIFSFDRSSFSTLAPPLTRSTMGTFEPSRKGRVGNDTFFPVHPIGNQDVSHKLGDGRPGPRSRPSGRGFPWNWVADRHDSSPHRRLVLPRSLDIRAARHAGGLRGEPG